MTRKYIRFLSRCALTLIAAQALATSSVEAQSANKSKNGSGTKTVTLQQMVEPAFRVQPVVQRLEAARGETLPFAFVIESYGRQIDCEVRPVALRQEETGVVFHDETQPAPNAIRLETPERFTITSNQPFEIKGEVTVPRNKAKFHSFGLLVRDAGQNTKFEPTKTPDGKTRTQAGVRFVTQYVLRCDIQVNNAPGEDFSNVEVKGVEIAAFDGLPTARVLLENPTESVQLFQVRGKFGDRGSRDAKLFSLIQPSRYNLEGDERELIKVLPKSRVRVEAPVPNPLFPGKHVMQLQMVAERRQVKLPELSIEVGAGDFPAQETQVVQVAEGLVISPVQLELGQAKGARRTLSVAFTNRTEHEQAIELTSQSFDGTDFAGLSISPPTFTLAPDKSRRVTLMVRSQKELETPAYGFVHVQSTVVDQQPAVAKLPLAMLYGPRETAQVKQGELALRSEGSRQKFVLPVTNAGRGFVPVQALLLISDEQGRTMRVTAGYGRWLHPDETRELEFTLPTPLLAGAYQLQWQIRLNEQDESLNGSTAIRIGDAGQPAASE
ncbi:MAG: hypothetical protein JNM18_13120 [Planctomycetaceae bacterium]|nr:hypothetical protein [Planctomycetaceae bacterium]